MGRRQTGASKWQNDMDQQRLVLEKMLTVNCKKKENDEKLL